MMTLPLWLPTFAPQRNKSEAHRVSPWIKQANRKDVGKSHLKNTWTPLAAALTELTNTFPPLFTPKVAGWKIMESFIT